MSAWVTEGVMRWGLRFCSRRSLWQQRTFLVTTSIKDTSFPCQQFAHICDPRQSQTWLSSSRAGSLRLYSQSRDHSDEEGWDHSSSPLLALSLPAEIHFDKTASGITHSKSPYCDRLLRCHSPSDVLDLTCQYSPTPLQIRSCLYRMWFTTTRMSAEQRGYELLLMFEHPAFDKLLQQAMENVECMSNKGIVSSLLSMIHLGVPHCSLVVQTFLQICEKRVNDFDEASLSILATCIKRLGDSPSVGPLKKVMRLIVDIRLPWIKDLTSLQNMIHVLGKDAPKELKYKLEKKALSMVDQINLPNAHSMISTMAAVEFNSRPLMDICSRKIAENLTGTPFNNLVRLLKCCKRMLYRDPGMLTGISKYIASTTDLWSNKQIFFFLHLFENLFFCPAALMEACAEEVISSPNTLMPKDLLCVLKVYSSLNYDLQHRRQQFLDCLTDALVSCLPKMSSFNLLKAVYFFCLLDHYPVAPLQHLLQSNMLEQLMASKSPSRTRMFQIIDLCLRLDRPPLPQPLTVPRFVLRDLTAIKPSVNTRLSWDLQNALGDQAYTMLQEMVVVENFYLIDGVITKPLPNQSSVTEASSCAEKECSPAESSQRIAVIYTHYSRFCYGTSNPRGALALKIRHLKALGYTPVLVTKHDLQCVYDQTRIDTLRRRIFPEHYRSEMQPN